MKNLRQDGLVNVDNKLMEQWAPALENYLGEATFASLSEQKRKTLTAMAASSYAEMTGTAIGLESDMTFLNGNNSNMAMDVQNPTAGGNVNGVQQPGTKGSGDRQFLVGICISIAAKTIGLELVQTVPATSSNITIKYLKVRYNGGDVANAANKNVHVLTLDFAGKVNELPKFKLGTKYVIGHKAPGQEGKMEFLELIYAKPARKGAKSHIFTVGDAFLADHADGVLSGINILANKPAAGAIIADGMFYAIDANLENISDEQKIVSIENTSAIEDFVPHQTTKGLNRTLTRSEADAGTDHMLELELNSDAFVIGNRTFTGHVSRLQHKRLVEQGIDAVPYLTAAMKNEIGQEINYQIISAARSYGLANHMEYVRRGICYNTFIGPRSVDTKPFSSLQNSDELLDPEGNGVADIFPDMDNLTKTMQYETIASIGTYLCMLIQQVCYGIGTDSRYGEGDAVVLSSSLAGYLAASAQFTKLSDKDVDMTASTGAKLSGHIGSIKVYVDVMMPQNSPFVTVLRTNQDVKVDMPGIEGDQILIPGLAYLVKDLLSTTELVPEGTGGHKLIIDSETDLIAIGDRPQAGYLTFAFDVKLPGLTLN